MTRRARRAPTQEDLDRAVGRSTRLRVSEVIGGAVLLEIADPEQVAAFVATLRLAPGEPFHCMCLGDQRLEFSGGPERSAVLTLHHGRSLRWEGWGSDVLLAEPLVVLRWLVEHGVEGPFLAWQEDRERERAGRRTWNAWKEAAPACIRPLVDDLSRPDHSEDLAGKALTALAEAHPDEAERVLALLAWFGSGEGAWSSFPSYEQAAERLLLRFPTEKILEALRRRELAPAELEGAGRLLSSWWFGQERPGESARVPADVAERLLAHAGLDEDKLARLRNALGR